MYDQHALTKPDRGAFRLSHQYTRVVKEDGVCTASMKFVFSINSRVAWSVVISALIMSYIGQGRHLRGSTVTTTSLNPWARQLSDSVAIPTRK